MNLHGIHALRHQKAMYSDLFIHFAFYRTLKDVVEMMKLKIDTNSDFDMVVRRSHVLSDALRRMDKASFDPRKRLNVSIRTCINYTYSI